MIDRPLNPQGLDPLRDGRYLRVDLTADASAPWRARQAVGGWLGSHPRLEEATLALSELVTNAVEHGKSPRVTVTGRRSHRVIRLEVHHPGPVFDVRAERLFLARGRGGRGLAIVEAVVDRWGVDSGVVWLELDEPDV